MLEALPLLNLIYHSWAPLWQSSKCTIVFGLRMSLIVLLPLAGLAGRGRWLTAGVVGEFCKGKMVQQHFELLYSISPLSGQLTISPAVNR